MNRRSFLARCFQASAVAAAAHFAPGTLRKLEDQEPAMVALEPEPGMTLLEFYKSREASGEFDGVSGIVRMLSQQNELMSDLVWVDGS